MTDSCWYGVKSPYAISLVVTLPLDTNDTFDLSTATSASVDVSMPDGTSSHWTTNTTILPLFAIDTPSNGLALPQATIALSSTMGGLDSRRYMPLTTAQRPVLTAYVTTNAGVQAVTYTGFSGGVLTGCSGGTGTMSTGGIVTSPWAALVRHVFASDGSDIPVRTQPSTTYPYTVNFTTPTGSIFSLDGAFHATKRPGS